MSEQAEALVGIGLELRFVLFGLHIGLDVPLSAFEIERVFSDRVADQISAKEYHFHKSYKAEVSGFVDDYEHDTIRVAGAFRRLPPEEPKDAFEHTAANRQGAHSLYDGFHNVDGENIFDALIGLCDEGIQRKQAIVFQ